MVGYESRMGEIRNMYKVLVEDLDVDEAEARLIKI
jgi:hypothetical protein